MAKEEKKELPQALQPEAVDEIPILTDKHHAFAMLRALGETPEDAYRATHDLAGLSPNQVWRAAMRLDAFEGIKKTVELTTLAGVAAPTLTREAAQRDLARLQASAERSNGIAVALQAFQMRAKIAGLLADTVAVTVSPDLLKLIQAIARISEKDARDTAAAVGIPWENVQGRPVALKALPAPSGA